MAGQKIAIVIAVAACLPVQALAQGSVGGTVGQHDKSTSGTFDDQGPRAQPRKSSNASPAAKPSGGCALASVWQNDVPGVGNSKWTITPDGTATEQGMGAAKGHASMSGRTLTITYATAVNNGVYVMQLNQDCSGASGKIKVTGGMLSGLNLTATFTAGN
jgi:hypothetical protein